ncbi:pyridoxamine-phosphate oxidase [Rhodotorula toruloides]|uniref:Pyridoxamine-phosphate oxidase n=1 Tax=Rhodotorula toruloides TaxID=5286 RepID=A0A511KMY1_RHOTO|nr:pyridoxamine-phosphate oxidase [Rhodotorula toruloides]
MPFGGNAPPPKIVPPPIPPSQLPQHFAPTPLSRAGQIAAFTLSAGIAVYGVLFYDYGEHEHCFMPVRRWVDQHTASFFTLTPEERRYVSYSSTGIPIAGASPAEPPAAAPAREAPHGVKPDTHTPIEYFKEHPVSFGKGKGETGPERMV